MNFRVTSYIYPLKERVILSEKLKFYLDNPRTEEDIAAIKDYWQRAYDSIGNKEVFPIHSETALFSLENQMFYFRDAFSARDEYLASVFQSYNREDFFGFLTRITILAYFAEDYEVAEADTGIERPSEAGRVDSSIVTNFEDYEPSRNLINYCQLLSLLIHSENEQYNGLSFVIDNEMPGYGPFNVPRLFIWMTYFAFSVFCANLEDEIPEGDDTEAGERLWMIWPSVRHRLIEQAKVLDTAFVKGVTEKLLIVGNMLEMAKHSQDVKLRLVTLTSVIELLVTHSPAFDRFNVEDSINKQFQLKAATLVHLNNKQRDSNDIKKRLKTIYQQRSNIVHGNFGEVEKYIRSLSRKPGHEEYFSDLITDLYVYVRAIIEEYLNDREFVEFLKES